MLAMTKHLLFLCLFPTMVSAQSMKLTDQLDKTVLYGDIAFSPDGAHVAWVQSTAAMASKQTYIRATSGNAAGTMVHVADANERIDSDLAWSPDSKTLVLFSAT